MIVVILINFNGNTDTVNCVRSLMASTGVNLPFIIIVDNDSRTKTIHTEVAFYPHLKVIYNDRNVGFGGANNLGIHWALNNLTADYIFLLNNDTIVFENTLAILQAELQNTDETTGLVTPRILFYHNPKLAWYDGGRLNKWRYGPVVDNFNKSFNEADENREVTFVSGCAMFFKTNALKRIKGFDPIFFMYEEDVELCFRLMENKIKMLFVPAAQILHKEFGSQENRPKEWLSTFHPDNPNAVKNLYSMIKNRLIVFYLHRSLWIVEYRFFIFFSLYLAKHCFVLILAGHKKVLSTLIRAVKDSMFEYRNRKNLSVN